MEENKSIGQEIKESVQGVKGFFFDLSGSKDKETYQDNPDVIYDEILFSSWVVSAICVGITAWFGVAYHLAIFQNSTASNAQFAMLMSIGILILGEIVKIRFGVRVGRLIFSAARNGQSKLKKLFLTILLGLLVFAAYKWSMDISAIAFGSNTANAKRQEVLKSTGNFSAVTKEYDEQIKEINKSLAKANKQTYAGKLTPPALDLIEQLSREKRQINASKNKAIDLASKRDSSFISLSNGEIANTETRLNDYGGKAEWLLILLTIFIIPICESILFIANRKKKASQKAAENEETVTQKDVEVEPVVQRNFFSMPQNSGQRPSSNNAESAPKIEAKVEDRRLIGFDYKKDKPSVEAKVDESKKKR